MHHHHHHHHHHSLTKPKAPPPFLSDIYKKQLNSSSSSSSSQWQQPQHQWKKEMSPPLIKPTVFMLSKPPPLCTIVFVVVLCILGFVGLHHPSSSSPAGHSIRKSRTTLLYRDLFLSTSSNSTLSSYLRALTLHPHLAGTPPSLSTLHYVHSHFQDLNFDTHIAKYDSLLSYPFHSSLSAHFPNGSSFCFSLAEKNVAKDDDLVAPYHAYSPSGSLLAKVVFANHGREEDYVALAVIGVNVSSCVVLVRKGGGLSRGGVVRVAASKGAVAVLLYTERDGKRGGGSAGVERGTVMRGVGDPSTPGWAGVEGGERLGLDENDGSDRFPKIPSLPLSSENADVILESLGGPVAPPGWRDSGRSSVRRVGPGQTSVNLTYQGEKRIATIYNVFAVIPGLEEPDRYVILGNHRDAWTYGAVDPNSGTATLLDIARRFANLMQRGWSPRRTIILSSWDAEEFGMVGSTEWVEQNLVNLQAKAVAYLNVDCAVQGPGFFASATPQLDDLILDVTKKVNDPDFEDAKVYENWAAAKQANSIQRLSAVDSDFVPFLHHAGVPSIDIYYGESFPVYHTAFDSFEWMTSYGDPLFHRHAAVAGIWGLLALHLADDSVLPFNYLSYAEQLQRHVDVLNKYVDQSISLRPLINAIQKLASAAKEAEHEAKQLKEQESKDDFVSSKYRALNDRLMLAERGFLDADGLQGGRWFKHLIYGPTGEYESKLNFFPGIADAISQYARMSQENGQAAIQHEIWRVARAIERAASALTGQLT